MGGGRVMIKWTERIKGRKERERNGFIKKGPIFTKFGKIKLSTELSELSVRFFF
jgi:hypothetical protein